MRVDFIIVGQGLAGTWLSCFLMKGGARVLVFDEAPARRKSASSAASGLINPITGKRLARQAMAEQLLPFAAEAYAEMESLLDIKLSDTLPIHTFFSSTEEAEFFARKAASHSDLLHFESRVEGAEHFTAPFGSGSIYPAQLIDVQALLDGWRVHLKASNSLCEEGFAWSECSLPESGVRYRDFEAQAVLDCSGAAAAFNPFFHVLPFALNKGEAIIASIPGLPRNAVYKHQHLSIVPWQDGHFWIGSTFEWDFRDASPTAAFRQKAEGILKQWLRLPATFLEHFAAIRPATVTRDAFAGMHPHIPALGILNGFGSKGCSLAPFLAHNLAQHLLHGDAIVPQADVARYARVLAEKA